METDPQSSLGLDGGKASQLVVFGLEEQRYALRLSAVEQIVRVVEITALPKAPEIILGVINIRGRIIPVYDIRARFRLPDRELFLSDHLIVARTSRHAVALVVDKVTGVVARPHEEVTEAQHISPSLEYVEGVVKLEDGLVFIHDLDTFLSAEEEIRLEEAMSPTQEPS
jgi:purine-binding chemotaxis protein CheW